MTNDSTSLRFPQIQICKPGNNGTVLQVNLTKKCVLLFTMAKQMGVTPDRKAKFDYDSKMVTYFSDVEAAKIVLAMEKALSGIFTVVKFPHLSSNDPKNIEIEFSEYNNCVQCKFSLISTVGKGVYSIYLNEAEMYLVISNLKEQISLYNKRVAAEAYDDMDFKEYIINRGRE